MMVRNRGKSVISVRKKYNPLELKKYFSLRNVLIMLLVLCLYFIIPNYIQAIILMVIFYPISVFTVRTTKYFRGIGIETITPFTIFLGYRYGWQIALFFGFGIGTYIWSQVGMNQKTLMQCIMNAVAAFLGFWAAGWFPGNFVLGYVVAITIRNIMTFVVFLLVNPDVFNNLSHLVSDVVWNTLILTVFMNLLYQLVVFISPRGFF
jgi:hypothetical protein